MHYFAIVGNQEYAVPELEMMGILDYHFTNANICIRTNDKHHLSENGPYLFQKLKHCSQIIKRGKVYDHPQLTQYFDTHHPDLIGIANKDHGMQWKKSFPCIKRFKIIDLLHTDREIKQHGKELIALDLSKNLRGIVQGRQDISLYETIDFERPVRSMDIGMMPAKLALLLVNVAMTDKTDKTSLVPTMNGMTIWDPFVGLGTTGFLVNWMGYNFIGSDINITPCKQNVKWRKTTKYVTDAHLTLFKHDITKTCRSKLIQQVDAVVTEGWLGPKIPHLQMPIPQLYDNLDKIWEVYRNFLEQMLILLGERYNVICTSPRYVQIKYGIGKKIQQWCQANNLSCESLPMYMRKGQKAAREIWRIQKKESK